MRGQGLHVGTPSALRLGRAWLLGIGLALGMVAGVSPAAAVPDASTGGAGAPAGHPIRVGETVVFTMKVARAGIAPDQRAARANRLLEQEVDSGARNRVRVVPAGELTVVYVGRTPILQLGPDDARAAGDSSPQVLGGRVARELDMALARERRRARMAHEVFSISLVVFAGLLSYLLLVRFDAIAVALHGRLRRRARAQGGLRVGEVEILKAAGLRRLVDGGVSIASALLKLATFFAWVTFSLSMFPALHGVRDRLVHAFVAPILAVLGRLVSVLQTGLVVVVLAIVLGLLLRFFGLLFESVARGETKVGFLPPSQALLASGLVRIVVVVAVIAVATPILSSGGSGLLSKLVDAALLAVGFGLAPLFASVFVGARLVFSGGLCVGDRIAYAEHVGVVEELGLVGASLRTTEGGTVFLPYLPMLLRPLVIERRAEEPASGTSDPPPPTNPSGGAA